LPPWRVRPSDEGVATRLAAEARLRPLTARILVARGLDDPERVARFLAPRLADLRAPVGMADLERALDRLQRAILAGERIGVFGDYDVDGVTTAAVLTSALRGLGAAAVVPRAASRSSGYGLGPAEAARFLDDGCRVVVTGDCGTSDHEAIALCAERGVDVIVIDHHQVPEGSWRALALINPHRRDDEFPFKGLASCGVAFYLGAALRSRLRAAGHPAAERFDPRSLLDLVALGTLADLVPLVDENRILVTVGLRELQALRRPGLRALARVAELEDAIGAVQASFRLCPRLNAAGRLGEAQLALDLLLAPDEATGNRLAEELDAVNRERQRIQELVWSAASQAAAEQAHEAAMVLGAEGWHHGVVGIVAAKLVERFRRPAVVVGFKDGRGRGSARTVGGFDLYRALAGCREHLTVFGGHAQAAGMSLDHHQLDAFRAAFVRAAAAHFRGAEEGAPEVDAEAQLADLELAQVEELGRLGPFGAANAEPVLALSAVVARGTRVVGETHLQLTLAADAAAVDAIAFGMADRDPGAGATVHVIGVPEVDTFRGYRRTRLRVRHLVRVNP
jgi:single-stranded-DNA-specific exonuclease